ncbi:hypothetical protein MP228_002102 [Amoeboaphelidium protococcarum]|nr:hypothetical protein MP228_002102 [Amoeboaphelidium protococcarum]
MTLVMTLILAILIQIIALSFICNGADIEEGPALIPRIPTDVGNRIYSLLDHHDQQPEWRPTEDVMHYFQRSMAYCNQYSQYRMASSGGLIPKLNNIIKWCRVSSFKYKALKLMINAQRAHTEFHVLNRLILDWIQHNRLRYVIRVNDQVDANLLEQLKILQKVLPEVELAEFELRIVGSLESLALRDPREFSVAGWKTTIVVQQYFMLDAVRIENSDDVNLLIKVDDQSQDMIQRLQSAIDNRQLQNMIEVGFELYLTASEFAMHQILQSSDIQCSQLDLVKSIRQIELIFGIQSLTQQQYALFSRKMGQIFNLFEQEAYDGQITYLVGFNVGKNGMSLHLPHAINLLEAASSVKPTINVQYLPGELISNTYLVPSYIWLVALGKLQPLSFVSPLSILWSSQDITMFASALARVPTMLEEHQIHPNLCQDFKILVMVNQLRVKQLIDLLKSILLGPFKRVELIIEKEGLWQQLMELNLSEMIQELDIPNHFELLALSYVPYANVGTPVVKQSVLLVGDVNHAWFLQSEILALPNGIPEAVDDASPEMSQTDIGESLREEPAQNRFSQRLRPSWQRLRSKF